MRLKGKVAIVTGGARGIGWAVAQRFEKEGAHVFVLDRDIPLQAKSWVDKSDSNLELFTADVTDPKGVKQVVNQIHTHRQTIDILVNCAGINPDPAPVIDTTLNQWQTIMETNLTGVFVVSSAFLPYMNKGGSIVHIASILGLTGVKSCSAYSATKGGIISLTRAMARDHAPQLRVNCICPGAIETQMFEDYLNRTLDAINERDRVLNSIPMGRVGLPEDVANAALFLASDESGWVTGTVLTVDGGDSC